MNQPLVSIVIPCFNAASLVGEAIESALAQTYAHKEVIVIDDGSTDETIDVLRSFGDQIRWETGPNRGACAARNSGCDIARGEYIQFLDADDLLQPEKLERQIPYAIERSSEIVYCRWRCVAAGGTGMLECSRWTHPDAVVHALRRIITTVAPVYPATALRRVGGWREELPCAQDYDLNLRLACAGISFWQLPEELVTLRRVAGSVSSNMLRILEQWEGIYWRAYEGLVHDRLMTDERAAAFAGGFAKHARVYLRLGEVERAKERIRQAYKMHPSGGINQAYGSWTRWMRRLIGPIATEHIILCTRSLIVNAGQCMEAAS